jgi:hypothetical protein
MGLGLVLNECAATGQGCVIAIGELESGHHRETSFELSLQKLDEDKLLNVSRR